MRRVFFALMIAGVLAPAVAQQLNWQLAVYESGGTAEIEIPGRGWLQAVTGRTVPAGARLATWIGAQTGFVLVPGEEQGSLLVTLGELTVMAFVDDPESLTFELVAGTCEVTAEAQEVTVLAGAARITASDASFVVGEGTLLVTAGSVELDLRGARVVTAGASVSLLPPSTRSILGQ